MEDFSNELFSSFFDDHLLADRNPLLDMEMDPPNPDIQQEHSYSLSGDSAPQSPSMSIKMDEEAGMKRIIFGPSSLILFISRLSFSRKPTHLIMVKLIGNLLML